MTTDDLMDGAFFAGLAAVLGLSAYAIGHGLAFEALARPDQTLIENDKCSLQGGELLRGQAMEFVCVKPGAVKWRRVR